MTSSGSSSGSVWETWIRDHSTWMAESRDPAEFIAKLLWTPFGAASTGCAAYCDELARHPAGTLTKTAGVALSALIPGAGLLGVAADAAAIATGQVIGSGLNDDDDRLAADRRHRLAPTSRRCSARAAHGQNSTPSLAEGAERCNAAAIPCSPRRKATCAA